jgi:hypothetical protein
MTKRQLTRKPMRLALLLEWRSRGFTRPRYGLVDDDELLLTGKSIFLSTDGQSLPVIRRELLLLQPASNESAREPG